MRFSPDFPKIQSALPVVTGIRRLPVVTGIRRLLVVAGTGLAL
ncbi:hypothetical protein [Novosphingobium sp. PY1]|nr:hypothetical protein [Novosphingobium sp. PY1]